jgi:transmembrane protein EpsG
MLLIWINLIFVYVFSSMARITTKVNQLSMPQEFNKPNKLFVLFVMTALALVSGLRNNLGDTTAYMRSYELMDKRTFMLPSIEQGFYLLQRLLLTISSNPQILIFTTAVITNILIVAVLYKYSRMFELSIYVYITSALYIASMNGIRQFLAAAILFAATKYLLDGRWIKYMLVILLATTIHQSAIIFIPLYFFVRRPAWTKTTFFLLGFAIVMVIGYNELSGVIFDMAGDSYAPYKDFNEGGTNIIRVIVQVVPLLLVFLGRERLRELLPKSDYIVNMSLVGLVFMIISTQNWIFARYTIYFGLYNLILISWAVKLFVKREQRIVYYSILVLYLIYFYYENVVTLNIQYRSDYLNFF